ncbi:hypothetical protein EBZ39_11505 [bacterium]|nr:hypothetical protein [bacterium]
MGALLIVIVGIILGILTLLLPVFVFQISGATVRSEELLKKALAELEKINEHLASSNPPQE